MDFQVEMVMAEQQEIQDILMVMTGQTLIHLVTLKEEEEDGLVVGEDTVDIIVQVYEGVLNQATVRGEEVLVHMQLW
jgi:hypothetical protein